jgi:hypothetical protein
VRRGSVVADAAESIVLDRELEEDKKPAESEPPRIRCPLCGWSARKEDRWFCECGHSWNTFDTGGVCPACLQQLILLELSLETNCIAPFFQKRYASSQMQCNRLEIG